MDRRDCQRISDKRTDIANGGRKMRTRKEALEYGDPGRNSAEGRDSADDRGEL